MLGYFHHINILRIILYSVVLCIIFQIDNETFSPLPVIFSRKNFHVNLTFFFFDFIFHHYAIDHYTNYLTASSGYSISGVLHSPRRINKGSQARVPNNQERLTVKEVMAGFIFSFSRECMYTCKKEAKMQHMHVYMQK